MGHLFQRTYRTKEGKAKKSSKWTYKFYHRGKQKYYNTGETGKLKAKANALAYEAEVNKGAKPWQHSKVNFSDLKEEIILDYEINGKKSLDRMMRSLKSLSKEFEGFKAQDITTDAIRKYIKKQQDSGKANATINRELAALKRMFNLATQQSPPKLANVPYIPMLQENNARTGFFDHKDFLKLFRNIDPYLKGVVAVAYFTGMRKEEILDLRWEQVDLKNGTLRLQETKTGKRIVPLDKATRAMIRMAHDRKKTIPPEQQKPYVFLNKEGTDKIKDIRGAWNAVCRKMGLGYGYKLNQKYVDKWEETLKPGPIMHDFRRTAVRNMIRAGVSEHVAMKISGHETRSVFDRYDIVNEADLKIAINKTHKHLIENYQTQSTN